MTKLDFHRASRFVTLTTFTSNLRNASCSVGATQERSDLMLSLDAYNSPQGLTSGVNER